MSKSRWIAIYAVIVTLAGLFFAGKRMYYNQPGAINYFKLGEEDIYNTLPIDSTDIVFIGDSQTQYFPVGEMSGNPHIKNRGIAENTSIDVLDRIVPIAKAHPQKIFLQVGINDINKGDSTALILFNYQRIIDTIRYYSPGTTVVIQSLFPAYGTYSAHGRDIADINIGLINLAGRYKLPYIDVYKALGYDSTLMYDGLHLNGRGYKVWYQALRGF